MNPHKGYWYGIALIGIVIGIILTFAEAFGEGHPYPRLGLLRMYVGVEFLAVLVGYVCFGKLLGLARRDALIP